MSVVVRTVRCSAYDNGGIALLLDFAPEKWSF